MDAYLVPGSPYVTFDFDGATPLFTSTQGGIKSFNGQDLSPGDSGKYQLMFG
jgi:endo-1,3(4)-beta-glucanase